MAKQDTFEQTIKSYLDDRAKTDELFAKSYAKKNKSVNNCCKYIMGEAKKRGNAVAMQDAEVFGLAVHYYDEDNIKINNLQAGATAKVSKQPGAVKAAKNEKETTGGQQNNLSLF